MSDIIKRVTDSTGPDPGSIASLCESRASDRSTGRSAPLPWRDELHHEPLVGADLSTADEQQLLSVAGQSADWYQTVTGVRWTHQQAAWALTASTAAGASGPTPVRFGNGFQFSGGSGGNGLSPRVAGVRVMDPVTSGKYTYPNGYVSYFNSEGQTVNPWTGERFPNRIRIGAGSGAGDNSEGLGHWCGSSRISWQAREMDPLTENDALQEASLNEVLIDNVNARAGVLFDLRGALQLRMAYTGLLVVHAMEGFSWVGDRRSVPRTAWNVVGSVPANKEGMVSLRLFFFPDAELLVRGRGAAFFAGDVPGLPDSPPDFAASDAEVRDGMAFMDSSFEPTQATFIESLTP